MGTLSHRSRWTLTILSVVLTIALVSRWLVGSAHSGASKIHDARAMDSPQRLRDVFTGRQPLRTARWREIVAGGDPYLDIDSSKLEWSCRTTDSGYLYFNEPLTNTWEFAQCKRRELSEVTQEDVSCDFYGARHPMGSTVFGENWRTNALVVYDGEFVLARLVKNPTVVYELKLRLLDLRNLRIQYREIAAMKPDAP